jgi:hypothetical protein
MTAMTAPSPRPQAARYIYDAPHDPAFAAALLRLILDEASASSDDSTSSDDSGGSHIDGRRVTTEDLGAVLASRVLSGEQSNTSVIIDLADLTWRRFETLDLQAVSCSAPRTEP